MVGLNGSFGRRLSLVEDLLPPPAPIVDQQALDRAEWLSIAPIPCIEYLMAVATETEADRHHLVANVVIEAVWEAARYDAPSMLEYVQAAVIDKAIFTLSWSLAGRSWNYGHHYEAIRLLLGDDGVAVFAESNAARLRPQPAQLVALWRAAPPEVALDVLDGARLGDAELVLLQAKDEIEEMD